MGEHAFPHRYAPKHAATHFFFLFLINKLKTLPHNVCDTTKLAQIAFAYAKIHGLCKPSNICTAHLKYCSRNRVSTVRLSYALI